MTMLFTLEAIKARHGDALLLHYGDKDKPRVAMFDGGPSGVWPTVKKRLEELRAHGEKKTGEDQLTIDIAVVTHLDDDHVHGILDMSRDLVDRYDNKQPLPWKVGGLWLNHFEDLTGADSAPARASAPASELQGLASDTRDESLRSSAAVLASIPQGRDLDANARKLGWKDNPRFDGGLVMAPENGGKEVKFDANTKATIVSPMQHQIDDLQKKWNEYMEKLKTKAAKAAEVAAYVDRSVYNLSSIVALVEAGGKKMLLTGDGRGDQVMEGLEAAGIMTKGGTLEVDLLKLPHHGSDNDVADDFFERIKAKHYVVSGDGNYGNPETSTLEMLSRARKDDKFTLHLTYRDGDSLKGRLVKFFEAEKKAGRKYKVEFRADDALSLRVDLLEKLDF
jgi:hypothetical protein